MGVCCGHGAEAPLPSPPVSTAHMRKTEELIAFFRFAGCFAGNLGTRCISGMGTIVACHSVVKHRPRSPPRSIALGLV